MIDYGIKAILIKVACFGLNKIHLGQSITDLYPYLLKLNKECDMNVCGEGGEYESLVLDCPHYKKSLLM
jgi:diphthine-ammonia ligase